MINIFRITIAGGIFALYGGLSPDWLRWGMLGMAFMIVVIKIEESNE